MLLKAKKEEVDLRKIKEELNVKGNNYEKNIIDDNGADDAASIIVNI